MPRAAASASKPRPRGQQRPRRTGLVPERITSQPVVAADLGERLAVQEQLEVALLRVRAEQVHSDAFDLTVAQPAGKQLRHPERDAQVLHHWLTHPASAFWQMTDLGLDQVLAYEQRLALPVAAHEARDVGNRGGIA